MSAPTGATTPVAAPRKPRHTRDRYLSLGGIGFSFPPSYPRDDQDWWRDTAQAWADEYDRPVYLQLDGGLECYRPRVGVGIRWQREVLG